MSEFTAKTGGISVETEHIFPIIKKWLYSEKEIFLRELVSNACDAITKLKRLASLGQYESNGEQYRITVSFSPSAKTITIADNGIGMTEDELNRYICQMALSGALEFVEKYEGNADDKAGIIGHFGLGFYSAFMVADTVDIFTRSFTGAPAVKWCCTEAGQYQFYDSIQENHGTSVILHVNADNEEFLTEYKLREILDRYCAFMPVEIYLVNEDNENAGEIQAINDVCPLWQRNASECSEEEYKSFYQKVFSDFREPLFWMHINADYPLNFKGILYFPKVKEGFDSLEGKIKLFYNQVFVADNIKEVIPEYLLMLRGVLDCPELPLNVSRSYLQNSAYVSKVSAHLVKKVADKITSMFNLEREKYASMYHDLKTFVTYASICDRKFYDRVAGALLFTTTNGEKLTLDEYLDQLAGSEKIVYYATDMEQQSTYIRLLKEKSIPVLVFDHVLDIRLAESIEQYRAADNIQFKRVDADLDVFKGEGERSADGVKEIFEGFSNDKIKLSVEVHPLSSEDIPAILTTSEESRRMKEMMQIYAPDAPTMPAEAVLVLNANSHIIQKLNAGGFGESSDVVAKQIYLLALLSAKKFDAEEMKTLLDCSLAILGAL